MSTPSLGQLIQNRANNIRLYNRETMSSKPKNNEFQAKANLNLEIMRFTSSLIQRDDLTKEVRDKLV